MLSILRCFYYTISEVVSYFLIDDVIPTYKNFHPKTLTMVVPRYHWFPKKNLKIGPFQVTSFHPSDFSPRSSPRVAMAPVYHDDHDQHQHQHIHHYHQYYNLHDSWESQKGEPWEVQPWRIIPGIVGG